MDAANTDEHLNIAIGTNALGALDAENGDGNVCIGQQAGLAGANNFQRNVAIGHYAFDSTTSNAVADSVVIGYYAGGFSSGEKAVVIGGYAGSDCRSGDYGVFIGYNAEPANSGHDNVIAIGYNATGSAANSVTLGNADVTLWAPGADNKASLGNASYRFADVFAVQTTTGGIFETGLKTDKIGDNLTGTIVVWQEDKLIPCDKSEDELVMGVIKNGKDEPIVLGAEPVLVTGKVNVGDYIVTSDKLGHGKSVKRGYLLKKDLFGKVIAQALEKSDDSESCLIKCMIRKM